MNYTFIALVENKPGVLNRVASLFRRRNYNIESLAVGRTEKPDISRMTMVVDCPNGDMDAHKIEANLYKLDDPKTIYRHVELWREESRSLTKDIWVYESY